MRKMVITLLALGLTAIVAAPTSAVSFWSETFESYALGNLTQNGSPWVNYSGAIPTDLQIVADPLNASNKVVKGDLNNAPDDARPFTEQAVGAKVYACFQLMIPTTVDPIRNSYIINFKDTGTSNFVARLGVVPVGSPVTGWTLAIGATVFTTNTPWLTALNYGQWYTVAIAYDGTNNIATLWVDPSSESSLSVTNNNGTPYTSLKLSNFCLREGTDGTGTKFQYYVDNIQVGDNFSDLCPSPTPTSSTTWGKLKSMYR